MYQYINLGSKIKIEIFALFPFFNQKNSSQLCCGVKNEEGVSLEGETMRPLPIETGFLNPFDTS